MEIDSRKCKLYNRIILRGVLGSGNIVLNFFQSWNKFWDSTKVWVMDVCISSQQDLWWVRTNCERLDCMRQIEAQNFRDPKRKLRFFSSLFNRVVFAHAKCIWNCFCSSRWIMLWWLQNWKRFESTYVLVKHWNFYCMRSSINLVFGLQWNRIVCFCCIS